MAFNRRFEQWMFLIIPGSLILGFLFSQHMIPLVPLIPYLFGFVTLTMGLGCGFNQLGLVFVRPLPILWTLIIAHLLLPLIAYGIGGGIFGTGSPFVVGMVLFTLIPLGVSSIIWVGLSGGSIPLMLAMVVLDSLLSPIIVPAGIHLLFGTTIEVETGKIMRDLLLIVVIPTLAGVLLHTLTRGKIQYAVQPVTAPLSKICFVAVVLLNAAAIAPQVIQLKNEMITLVPVIVLLVGICYAIGYFGSAPMRNRETEITISYATGMRNNSLGIVIALSYFSPLAAVPVVMSILIQQPIATLHHYVLQKINKADSGKTAPGEVR
jgi:BASS family bile acid:Na+ symporter